VGEILADLANCGQFVCKILIISFYISCSGTVTKVLSTKIASGMNSPKLFSCLCFGYMVVRQN